MAHRHDWEVAEPSARPAARRREDHDPAWQVAKRVVETGSTRGAEPRSLLRLQRLAGNGGVGALVEQEERSPVLDVVGKGGGSPLPAGVRSEMESGLGADFGSVRVHDGPQAAASAQAVQAKAYTVGDEIVFNRDAYSPDTETGRHTLAHELTHVVQQRSGPVEGTATGDGVAISDPGDRFEREAEANATSFMAGGSAATTTAAAEGPSVQREGGEEEELQAMPLQRQDEEVPEEEEMG